MACTATEQGVEIASEEHLEIWSFIPTARLYGCRQRLKFLGEMLIHGAVQFIQFLLADAGEYTEWRCPGSIQLILIAPATSSSSNRGARLTVADSPADQSEYQAEPEHIDFELAEEADHIVAHLVVA